MAEKTELLLELTECGMKLFWLKWPRFPRASSYPQASYDWLPVFQGESWEVVLQDYLAQQNRPGSKTISTTLLLPVTRGFVREFSVPPFSRDKLRQAVKYLVEEEVPLPEKDRIYDFGECSEGRIVIGAMRRSQLNHVLEVLHQLGLEVVRVDFAALRIAALLSLAPDETAFFFARSAYAFCFGVFRGNTPEFYRHFPLDSDTWEPEVRNQIRYYQHDSLLEVHKIVTIGHEAQSSAINLFRNGQTLEWKELKEQEVLHSYLFPHRLPLPPLNLLQEFALRQKLSSAKRIALALTVLGVVFGLALSGYTYRQVTGLKDHITMLEMENEQFRQNTIVERNQWQEWNAIQYNSPQLGREMMTLQRLIPTGIEVEEIELSSSSLYFAASALRGGDVQELMVRLKQNGWENISLLHYNQQHDEKLRFTLSSTR